jgi:A/G-specific adenine glycosylase
MPKNDPAIQSGHNGIWCFAMWPKSPDCTVCVLSSCIAKRKSRSVTGQKIKVRNRYFNYIVVIDANNIDTKKNCKRFGTTYMSFDRDR